MTTYSPYLGETGPGTEAGDSSAYSMGVEFYATTACWITAIHWWQAAAGSAKSTATRTGALWQVGSAPYSSGTNLSGTQTFPATADGWNTLTLSSPVALPGSGSGVTYKAVVCHPAGGYSADSHYYDSGTGSTNTTFGPVVIFNAASSTAGQNSFVASGTMAFPNAQFNSTRYWVSFTVSDTDPASGAAGALAGATPALSGALTGGVIDTGALAGATPALSGALTGDDGDTGALAGATRRLAGALTGDVICSGALAGTTPTLTGALTGDVICSGALAGTTPTLTGALIDGGTLTGALASATPALVGALTGSPTTPQINYPLYAGMVIDNVARYRAGVPVMNYGASP